MDYFAEVGGFFSELLGGHRCFLVVISDFETAHGRQMRWQLRARNATDTIRQRWAGASWIIELVSTVRRDGKPFHHVHLY